MQTFQTCMTVASVTRRKGWRWIGGMSPPKLTEMLIVKLTGEVIGKEESRCEVIIWANDEGEFDEYFDPLVTLGKKFAINLQESKEVKGHWDNGTFIPEEEADKPEVAECR